MLCPMSPIAYHRTSTARIRPLPIRLGIRWEARTEMLRPVKLRFAKAIRAR